MEGSQDNPHFHVSRWVDPENFYLFGYSADGYYIAVGLVGGEQFPHVPYTASDALRQGVGATNPFRMECVGGQLRFWVNGELLVDISGSTLAEGDTESGVVSLDGECSDVAFDNLVVTAPAPR